MRARIRGLVEPVVVHEGVDLEDVEVVRAGRRYVLRITVDADGGINHDELSDVSRAISAALDDAETSAGELTPGAYTLELSSPGLDRLLTLARHWRRNHGRLVSVKIGGKLVTGRVVAVTDGGVGLDVNGRRTDATFAELGPGRVQIEFNRVAELTDDDLGPEFADDTTDLDDLADDADDLDGVDGVDHEDDGAATHSEVEDES